jgi:thiol-disulfide isomerase/thioredoxin
MYKLLFILVLFCCGETIAQSEKTGFASVELKTLDGKKYVFNHFEGFCVVVFLSPSCPLSQKYTRTLNELSTEFDSTVKFFGVFAETDPDLDAYEKFKKKYQVPFELLVDRKKSLARSLSASVTPEAFVLRKGKIVYHGAIDDWAIALGKTRNKATVNFVRNAIQSAMASKTPVPDYTKPIGCFID